MVVCAKYVEKVDIYSKKGKKKEKNAEGWGVGEAGLLEGLNDGNFVLIIMRGIWF